MDIYLEQRRKENQYERSKLMKISDFNNELTIVLK